MQRQSVLTLLVVLVSLAFIIIGCRVQDAGDSPGDPTPASQDNIIEYSVGDSDFVPSQEVVDTDSLTVVAQDFTASPTSTEDTLPTSTPTATIPLSAGQGGNFATFTSEPAASNTPSATATVNEFVPPATNTALPTATPTNTPTDTPTATNTPTATATDTPTATATNTETPSLTPTPEATATVTPFPAIGGGPSGVEVAQDQVTPTPNDRQLTATAFILSVTQEALSVTQEAELAAGLPTSTSPFDASGGGNEAVDSDAVDTTGTTNDTTTDTDTTQPDTDTGSQNTGPVATSFPDCDYLILPGETLSQIARSYSLDTEDIANYNGITNQDFIEAGDTISIPGCGRNPTPTPTQDAALGAASTSDTAPGTLPDNSNGPVTYVTQAGDNIYNLSETFGVTMRALWNANINVVPNINVLSIGETLTIPQRTEPVDNTTTDTTTDAGS